VPTSSDPIGGIREAHEAGWRGVRCTFTLSTGRVGTMTLAHLVSSTSGVVAVHEPAPHLLRLSKLAFEERSSVDAGPSERWRLVVEAARADAIWQAHRKGHAYFESGNRMTFFAPELASLFPDAKFVHLFRDPMTFVESTHARGWYAGHPWDWARIAPGPADAFLDRWERMDALEKIAWNWVGVNAYALDVCDSISSHRSMLLPSEALFSGRKDVVEQLFSFLELRPPGIRTVRRVLSGRLNASSTSGGGGAVLSQRDQDRIWEIVGPAADRLGVERERATA
jgi:hypothetical protein